MVLVLDDLSREQLSQLTVSISGPCMCGVFSNCFAIAGPVLTEGYSKERDWLATIVARSS
jgi:hypothetical protein